MGVLIGHDAAVAEWVSARTGMHFRPPFVAMGAVDSRGALTGGFIWTQFYRGGNIEITIAGHRWQKDFIRSCFRYAFIQCGCSRITARTRRGNALARRLLPKLGFQFEFTQKRYFGPDRNDDGLVFVMYRESAQKWLTHG